MWCDTIRAALASGHHQHIRGFSFCSVIRPVCAALLRNLFLLPAGAAVRGVCGFPGQSGCYVPGKELEEISGRASALFGGSLFVTGMLTAGPHDGYS